MELASEGTVISVACWSTVRTRCEQDPRSLWLGKMRQRRHPNVAAVALANKNARIVWAMLTGDAAYEPALSVKAA
ncbi:transposase [Bradyrhizobium sp. GM7.3]